MDALCCSWSSTPAVVDSRLHRAVGEQERYADFTSYWGVTIEESIGNWNSFCAAFNSNVRTRSTSSAALFAYNEETGEITFMEDVRQLIIEVWWQGHAPFGYRYLRVYKNIRKDFTPVASVMDEKAEEQWASETGHLYVATSARRGDRFVVLNIPAHIQGVPWYSH